jgi:hypothetical protein
MMDASPRRIGLKMQSSSLPYAARGHTSLDEAAARVAVSLALLSWLGVAVDLFWR